jgi:hypothetical protein
MKQYLLSIMQPAGPIPDPQALSEIMRDVDAVRQEMQDTGAWVFSAGLHEPSSATTLRPRDGEVLTSDGPFAEAKEQVGGLTIVRAPDLDAALDWGRKLALATTLPIEVRPMIDAPED